MTLINGSLVLLFCVARLLFVFALVVDVYYLLYTKKRRKGISKKKMKT
jgi:hypothetical protein